MDNNKKDPASLVDEWMKEIMSKLDIPQTNGSSADDLGADEQAIASAGLTHPDDMELEKIIQETLAETADDPPDEEVVDQTRFFAAPTQEEVAAAQAADEVQANAVVPEPVQEQEPEVEEVMPEDDLDAEAHAAASAAEKLRPKAKKGYGLWGIPHIISTVIWLLLIVAIGTSLGRTVWLCAKDVLALGKESFQTSITIAETDDISDVAQKLKKAGLIEYPKLFEMFTDLTGKCQTILRGTITFNEEDPDDPSSSKMVYDYNALASALSYRGSAMVTVDVMIPEGYNCAQIFALLEEKGVCSAAALEEYAISGTLDGYWFLTGVERGHKYCLEGFLFPDTYNFYLDDEPERVLRKLLNGFDNRFSDAMIDKFVALNKKTGLNLSLRDVVIMASIVEKEKASDPEGYSIASVFYNRLTHSGTYPLLQSDATIKYDVDYRSKGELITDAQINSSPYNTYVKRGLPAGPIANPGLASLNAALDPEDTDYYFFIYDKSAGMHRFSKTLAEHNAWAKKLGLG